MILRFFFVLVSITILLYAETNSTGITNLFDLADKTLVLANKQAENTKKVEVRQLYFVGKIGDKAVRMLLNYDGSKLNGFYYTAEGFSGTDINISGTISENRALALQDINNVIFEGKWKEKPNNPIIIDGAIGASKTAKKKSFHFEQEAIFLNANQKILTREIFEDYTKGKVHEKISLSYPEFKSSSIVNQQMINQEFYKSIDPNIEEIKKWNDEYSKNRYSSLTTADFIMDYKISYFDTKYLSIAYNGGIFSAGAANGYDFFETLTIDLSTGEIMKLENCFKNESYLGVISKYVREKLMTTYSLEDKSYLKNSSPNQDNFKNWTLTPIGIAVYFQKNSIGCGAEGKKHIVIPYKAFADNLKLQGIQLW